MPWKSAAQQKWGNSPSGVKALGATGVKEWNAATRGKKLPARLGPKAKKYKQPSVKLSSLIKGM
jgi:hypothetical protein